VDEEGRGRERKKEEEGRREGRERKERSQEDDEEREKKRNNMRKEEDNQPPAPFDESWSATACTAVVGANFTLLYDSREYHPPSRSVSIFFMNSTIHFLQINHDPRLSRTLPPFTTQVNVMITTCEVGVDL
jgi:hypothetical protein